MSVLESGVATRCSSITRPLQFQQALLTVSWHPRTVPTLPEHPQVTSPPKGGKLNTQTRRVARMLGGSLWGWNGSCPVPGWGRD